MRGTVFKFEGRKYVFSQKSIARRRGDFNRKAHRLAAGAQAEDKAGLGDDRVNTLDDF